MTPGPGSPYFGGDEVEEAVLIPDGIGPIVAYRAWQLDADGTIMSFHWLCPEVWSTSEWVGARCTGFGDNLETGRPHHQAPAEGCECGIYAWKRQDDVREFLPPYPNPLLPNGPPFRPHYASGVVELGGKVIEHEFGYRAEWARIVGILPISPFMERRWRRFGKHWVWDRWPVEPERA
jgi:hypothetical protein